jgi:hypothetical protein
VQNVYESSEVRLDFLIGFAKSLQQFTQQGRSVFLYAMAGKYVAMLVASSIT